MRTNREREELRGTVTAMKTTAAQHQQLLLCLSNMFLLPNLPSVVFPVTELQQVEFRREGAEAHFIYSSILM